MEIKELRVIQKPNECLHCGFEPVSHLLYGVHEIDEKMQRDIDSRRILLGGCSILKDSPKWFCSNCQTEYFLEKNN